MIVGLITYDACHLKTELLALSFANDPNIDALRVIAIPFEARPTRQPIFNHRPDMRLGTAARSLKKLERTTFEIWDGNSPAFDECDFFILGGAGLLDPVFAQGKPIINAHPGIIPTVRGLDSFKWSIHDDLDLGVTLHQIDENVDAGKVLKVVKTPVFEEDTIEQLAARHFQIEISLLRDFLNFVNQECDIKSSPGVRRMRMNSVAEKLMLERFDTWKESRV